MLAFFTGVFYAVFKRGKRRLGVLTIVVSLVIFVVSLTPVADESAQQAGYVDFSDQRAAETAGFDNSASWIAHRQKVEQERLAELAALAASEKAALEAEAARAKVADEAAAALRAQERASADAEAAETQKYGHHCLSIWDGSHPDVVRQVKRLLNDPDSFEHDGTSTWPVNAEGDNTVLMQFRARNGFGGMVKGRATGTFDNASCETADIKIVE